MISAWALRLALAALLEEPPVTLGDSVLARQLLPHEGDLLTRGRLLRTALRETIDSLRPVDTLPPDDPRWWPWRIYTGVYLEGKSRDDMQRTLAIATVTYTRAKKRGLQWIAAYLPYALQHERAVGQ